MEGAMTSPKPLKSVIAQLEQQLTKPPPISVKPTVTGTAPVARSESQPKVTAAATAVGARNSNVSRSTSATTGPAAKKWQLPSAQSTTNAVGIKPSTTSTATGLRPVSNRETKAKADENTASADGQQPIASNTNQTPVQPPWLAQVKARQTKGSEGAPLAPPAGSGTSLEKTNDKTNGGTANRNTTGSKPTPVARRQISTDLSTAANLQQPAVIACSKDDDKRTTDDDKEKRDAVPQPQSPAVVSVGSKSYRLLPNPASSDNNRNDRPPRKSAKPPAVDLSSYKQQQQQHPRTVSATAQNQTNTEEDGDDIYDDVDVQCTTTNVAMRKSDVVARQVSTISRISEFTEEQETGIQRHDSDGEIYDDIGQAENDNYVDEEIYSELD